MLWRGRYGRGMAREKHSPEMSPEAAELLAKLASTVSDQNDPWQLLDRLQQVGRQLAEPAGPQAPSRRRPRRSDVVTYRVRVDLVGTKPPLWRRLELASDMLLDELHEVLQAAFGWTDSHLHRFGSGPGIYAFGTEQYLCPFEVEEGEPGVPEQDVRLDEVLVEAGDTLLYLYDFGDDWEHRIKLEAVTPREGSARRAVCTTGRREAPAEDCGGVGGYELGVAATDPAHPDHAAAVAEFARRFGDDLDPSEIGPTPFDIETINEELADLGAGSTQETELPGPLADLVAAVRDPSESRELRQLAEAALREPVRIDADAAARMVWPYTWLLDRVGADGITLTGSGYLPPAHVEAAVAALDAGRHWIGRGNRENHTAPVLQLRTSAQQAGLLRKYRGKVLRTARGKAMGADPVALWWHLAERIPARRAGTVESQAGLLFLTAVASQGPDRTGETVARFLDTLGWIAGDGSRITAMDAARQYRDTAAVLRLIGAVPGFRGRGDSTPPEGLAFARAALRTWREGQRPA